ncbi:MAG TPA: prepilin-type N-terminal cleavage/methylation domain-containing protein, partial [Candidatus Gracilibacteria bacterium]|nr:prepilin-type N-terminal cleavage/methylation domain-containing protein [Candidatus Gracilibacteria bacterium]
MFGLQRRGFTILEAVIASAILMILLVGSYSFLGYLAKYTENTQKIVKADWLAQNSLVLAEEVYEKVLGETERKNLVYNNCYENKKCQIYLRPSWNSVLKEYSYEFTEDASAEGP